MSRLISIGLPVYNGGEQLRHALDSLLAQSDPNFELIISDNCSTDDVTQKITEDYARRDSRIRLIRQPVNLGAQGNFLWLLEQARGDYFMWAAHDDSWSPNYVEVLARQLDEARDAVLATGFTEVESTSESGTVTRATTLMAPNSDRWATLDLFIKEFACVWIYGMFRTPWLRTAAPELLRYPFHYGDLIWLFGMLLKERVVGDREAIFHYHQTRGKYKERTNRKKLELWASVAYHVTQLNWSRLPVRERPLGLLKAWGLIYQHHISRGNPIGTSVRIAKLAVLWSWFGIEAATHRILAVARTADTERQHTHKPAVPTDRKNDSNDKERRAA